MAQTSCPRSHSSLGAEPRIQGPVQLEMHGFYILRFFLFFCGKSQWPRFRQICKAYKTIKIFTVECVGPFFPWRMFSIL